MSLSFTICKQGLIRVINGYSYKIECYYYDKNTLGDIVAIRDQDGEIVAKYEYDAWGNTDVISTRSATACLRKDCFVGR